MPGFDETNTPEQRQEYLRMEILRLSKASGLNNEQTQQVVREVLQGLIKEEQAAAKSPGEQPSAAALEILKSTTIKLFMPKTTRERHFSGTNR